MDRWGRRYPGKYVGVVDGRAVAVGEDQRNVFRQAEKGIPRNKEVGIFYLPSRKARPFLIKIR